MIIIFLLCSLLSFNVYSYPLIPQSHGSYCTSNNPDFDEYRYADQIPHCRRNVSSQTKRELYKQYGIAYDHHQEYTIDHIIPLSLGGDNSKFNLWPQHKDIYTGHIEYQVYQDVVNEKISIQEGINAILIKKFNPEIPWNEIYQY